jgi:hypothetical protein
MNSDVAITMETHRYVRPLRSSAVAWTNGACQPSDDIYNLQIPHSRIASVSTTSNNSNANFDYWTNGTTTLLATTLDAKTNSYNTNAARTTLDATLVAEGHLVPMNDQSSGRKSPSLSATKSSTNKNSVFRNSLLAGGMAGMVSTLFWCHPFEMVRIKIQQRRQQQTLSTTTVQPLVAPHHRAYSAGFVKLKLLGTTRPNMAFPNAILHGGRTAGLSYYTAGLSLPAVAAQAVYKGTVFTVNNLTRHALVDWNTRENYKLGHFQRYHLRWTDQFACGFLAGAVNGALFVTPVEYVRHELQSQQKQKQQQRPVSTLLRKGTLTIVRHTLQSSGASGFWRGLAPTVLRDSIGWGFFFTVLAYSQQQLSASLLLASPSASSMGSIFLERDDAVVFSTPQQQQQKSFSKNSTPPPSPTTPLVVMMSGGLAGLAFWMWALPLDTIKTWIQSGTAQSVRHALKLSRERGLRQTVPSLFGGWQVSYGRGVPAAAIYVTAYTVAYNYFTGGGDHSEVEQETVLEEQHIVANG